MASRNDDDDPELDDRECLDEADVDQDEGDEKAETEPCPYCGKPVYEQTEVCPHCRSYISFEDAPPHRKPLWIIVGVIICLLIVLLFWVL